MTDAMTTADWAAASGVLLGWLADALLLGTLLAAITYAITRGLRATLRPAIEVTLWSIVLIKFLWPNGPAWTFSLGTLGGGLWRKLMIAPDATSSFAAPEALLPASSASFADVTGGGGGSNLHLLLIAAGYCLLVLLIVVWRASAYARFRAWCMSMPLANEATRTLVHSVCRRLGVRRIPGVRVMPDNGSPFVMGIMRPLLVLPESMLVRPNELETVVVHEVTHLRRGDLLVRCLQVLAGALLFFWPVVAWVNRRIDQAREHACDEWALHHGRLTPGEYARCLLAIVHPARPPSAAYRPAFMAGHVKTIERRIDVILTTTNRAPGRGAWGLASLAIVAAWAAIGLTGIAQAQSKEQYANTPEDMTRHAQVVYELVSAYPGGDVNGDGEVTKEECWAFVTAAVIGMPEKVLAVYPWADANEDGKLNGKEAYLFQRGDYDLQKLSKQFKKQYAEAEQNGDEAEMQRIKQERSAAEIGVWHAILDRRAEMLSLMDKPPAVETVQGVAQKFKAEVMDGAVRKVTTALKDILSMRAKIVELREKAASVSGDEADKYLRKANELLAEADQQTAKLSQHLQQEIARSEAAGETEDIEYLQNLLSKLEEAETE